MKLPRSIFFVLLLAMLAPRAYAACEEGLSLRTAEELIRQATPERDPGRREQLSLEALRVLQCLQQRAPAPRVIALTGLVEIYLHRWLDAYQHLTNLPGDAPDIADLQVTKNVQIAERHLITVQIRAHDIREQRQAAPRLITQGTVQIAGRSYPLPMQGSSAPLPGGRIRVQIESPSHRKETVDLGLPPCADLSNSDPLSQDCRILDYDRAVFLRPFPWYERPLGRGLLIAGGVAAGVALALGLGLGLGLGPAHDINLGEMR
jgi:hypothetical protein